MKLTVLNKYTRLWMTYNRKALHENRSLQASRICGCGFKELARYEAHEKKQHSGDEDRETQTI